LYDVKYSGLKELNSIELRKEIMTKTNINKNNLSKYLKAFEDAGIIIRDHISNIPKINGEYEPILNNGIIEVNFKIVSNG
jgi:DNA-binding HxlR family transcriptional regulator